MVPVGTQDQRCDHYRRRPLSPERYEKLLALKEELRCGVYPCAFDISFTGEPGHGWWNEIWLAETAEALIEVFELIHLGHAPGEVIAERCEDYPLGDHSVQYILDLYRYFSKTGIVEPLRELERSTDRVKLTRAVIRWRLKKHTVRQIAQRDIPRKFPGEYPNGVSCEKVRGLLKRYFLNERGFKVTRKTYSLCSSDELSVERALMTYVRRHGGYMPPLSEKNGSQRRSEVRQELVNSNPNIETALNWREAKRLWLKDLKAWVTENAPKVGYYDEILARNLWEKKLDDWLTDPVFAWVLGETVVDNPWTRHVIEGMYPEMLTWPLRRRMQWIFSRRKIAEGLELPNTYRRWQRAKNEWTRAIKVAQRRISQARNEKLNGAERLPSG